MAHVVIETAGWICSGGDTETVEVTLSYDTDDPFAVSIDIAGEGRRTTWVIARDLLADGLRSMVPLGEGRVQVQATSVLTEISCLPEHPGDGRPVEAGVTVLRLPWWNTRELVRLSQVEVPRGEERCDVDAWVAALTAPQEG